MDNKEKLVNEWFNRALSSLEKAKTASSNEKIYFEDLCFDCQQAVEKALKSLLINNNKTFPNTHSLSLLIDLLTEVGIYIPKALDIIEEMSDYAVTTRYPGYYEPITKDDFDKALELTIYIIEWIKRKINAEELF